MIWLSASLFGYEVLKNVLELEGINLIAIITLSDESQTIMYDSIKNDKWYKFGTKVYEIKNINDEKELIKNLNADLIVMCGWRQIISKKILDIPKKGIIGFHSTLLPIGRGPAALINTILNNFTESGVTMFHFDEGVDTGDIIAQDRFSVQDDDDAKNIYNKMIKSGRKLAIKYLPLVSKDIAPRRPQDNTKATTFTKPKLSDNEIHFETETIDQIYNKIKALSKPYRGAYIKKDGKKLIIWKAEFMREGRIIKNAR